MNKKGSGPLAFIALMLVFDIIWFVWLGGFIAEAGQSAITAGNLTGVEAFFFANMNIIVFIGNILGMIGFLYFGGGG